MSHDATLDIQRATHLSLTSLMVSVTGGPDKGARLTCKKRRTLIGSGEGCDLVLKDGTVSRSHLEIHLEPDGFSIVDLQSKNGTLLGGIRLGTIRAAQKLSLQVGATTLQLEPLGKTSALPLANESVFGEVLGESEAMRQLFAQLKLIAASDAHVLLEGETGTGKELLARAIHDASPRRDQPYLILDCASLSPSLAQRELFGHRKGAFTDAKTDAAGLFELAHQGTLFIDEVGELPLEMQPLFLRAIQEGEITRLGATQPTAAKPRLIFATHRNLQQAINNGTFRADLYYRISVAPMEVPPLRERQTDALMLAQHFLLAIGKEAGQPLSPQTAKQLLERQQDKLLNYSWPGNVRELKNWCERLFLRARDPLAWQKSFSLGESTVDASNLGACIDAGLTQGKPFRQAKEESITQFEFHYLKALITKSGGNISEAARLAQMDRRNFQKLLHKYGL